jgi:serine protease Do
MENERIMTNLRVSRLVCAFATFGLIQPLSAQDRPQLDRRTPVVRVYEQTQKAVVNISGERTVSRRLWPDFGQSPGFDSWGPMLEQEVSVLGSGLVVHEDGLIITNAHVVEGVNRIKVVFSDGREFQADIVSVDAGKDLAVLAVKAPEKLPVIELGRSDDLMIGETVIAIGNPYGYANTVTSGVVSAVGRDIQVSEDYWLRGLIQTDAPINPGNSGGPLLNVNAELIGITTAIRSDAQNIGFAIPVDALVENLSHMLMPEKLRRVRLGLTIGRMQGRGQLTGLSVDSVSKGSPADERGIAPGDLIVEIDGHKLESVIDFYVRMMHKDVGEPIRLTCVRPKEAQAASRIVELALLPRPLPDGRVLTRDFFQMEVSDLTPGVARRFGFRSGYPILIVTGVDPQGTASQSGIQAGDLLLQVNDATVRNMEEFSLEMEKVTPGDAIQLQILRISTGLFGQIERRILVRLQAKPPTPTSPSAAGL